MVVVQLIQRQTWPDRHDNNNALNKDMAQNTTKTMGYSKKNHTGVWMYFSRGVKIFDF